MILDGRKKLNIDRAVQLIKSGDVVAFPTETVYGLGADLGNLEAVSKIFRVKGRPTTDPLIAHIGDADQLSKVVKNLSKMAESLIAKFWPGPLTLVGEKTGFVPDLVTAGLPTVAVRMPRHLIALALIKNSGKIIVAPSANRFQHISPTSAKHVEMEFGDSIPLILDGGPCEVGLESTVVSVVGNPTILRLGGISKEEIQDVCGEKLEVKIENRGQSKPAPGMLEFHYAPGKPLRLFSKSELKSFLGKRSNKKLTVDSTLICFSNDEKKEFQTFELSEILVLSNRGNSKEAGKNLYSTIRNADLSLSKRIFALECPDDLLGATLNDRLRRAQHE